MKEKNRVLSLLPLLLCLIICLAATSVDNGDRIEIVCDLDNLVETEDYDACDHLETETLIIEEIETYGPTGYIAESDSLNTQALYPPSQDDIDKLTYDARAFYIQMRTYTYTPEKYKDLYPNDAVSWWPALSGNKSLMEVLIQPQYANAPVKIVRRIDKVIIDIYVDYTGSDVTAIIPGTNPDNLSYRNAIEKGFKKWENRNDIYIENKLDELRYDSFMGAKGVMVAVNIHHKGDPNIKEDQKFFTVNFSDGYCEKNYDNSDDSVIAYVSRPATFSSHDRGTIYMFAQFHYGLADGKMKTFTWDAEKITAVAAHELGHILTLGDAYNSGTRTVPVTKEIPQDDIMRGSGGWMKNLYNNNTLFYNSQRGYNDTFTSNDIEMILNGFQTYSYQSFDRERRDFSPKILLN